nr:hypothetical protein [Tanacetum cinerariifolium]
RSKQSFILEESPIDTMADQRTMTELLRAPTEGYAEAIVVPPILAEKFELKHSLINMRTSDQFFGLEKDNPHDHIRWFNKITSTIKYKDVPNSAIKLMLFPFSLAGAARRTTNLRKEISNLQQRFDESFHEACYRYKDLLRACPHHGGNLLERRTQDVLTIIENKSKELRNEMKNSIQASMSNQTNEIKNMMASLFQMNTASTSGSGSLPSNTVANPKGELKAITTQSGLVLDGPTVPTPPPFINPEEDGRVEKTLTDQDLSEYTIKVPPPPVQKYKPPSQRDYVVH